MTRELELDLEADLNAQDDDGIGWSTLADARSAAAVSLAPCSSLDRQRRTTHRFPVTRQPAESVEAAGLVEWCQARATRG